MYAHCHICRHDLGANDEIEFMRVGRKLAYDVDRGRLWIVCPHCGEWNLTPLEERWEAIESCERHFRGAPVRVSTANVGLARVGELELIRVGHALRDELANWRYGPRFRRRQRRVAILSTGVGVVSGGALGGVILAGISTGSVYVTGYLVAAASFYAVKLASNVRPLFDLRFTDGHGRKIRLSMHALRRVELTREDRRRGSTQIGVWLPLGGDADFGRYEGDEALPVLGAVLPRLNWQGASVRDVSRATALVDQAEELAAQTGPGRRAPRPPWARIAITNWPTGAYLDSMHKIPRLALEMAVSEELERRALAGDAGALAQRWRDAEEVAHIADNMFLPASVTDWLTRRART